MCEAIVDELQKKTRAFVDEKREHKQMMLLWKFYANIRDEFFGLLSDSLTLEKISSFIIILIPFTLFEATTSMIFFCGCRLEG